MANGFDEFLFPDWVRTRIRAYVAETKHVQGSTVVSRGREALYIAGTFAPVKAVKEYAVKHDRKLPAQGFEMDSAGDPLHDRLDLLRRGYARVTHLDPAAGSWVSAFAIDWALAILGWNNPAPPAKFRRCVDVIARYAAS